MKIKSYSEFINENLVTELSSATIDAARAKRSGQLMDRGNKGENVEAEYNKMADLYRKASTRERYHTSDNSEVLLKPAFDAAATLVPKLEALVQDEDVYGTIIFGDKRKGPIAKKVLCMYAGGSDLVLGEVNAGNSNIQNESGSRFIIVRIDESSTIFVPDNLLAQYLPLVQQFLNLCEWKNQVRTQLQKFAHTEGSHTITTELQSELPKLEEFVSSAKAADRVKAISTWVR